MIPGDEGTENDTLGEIPPPLDALAARLAVALRHPLPGLSAQERMAPRRADGGTLHGERRPDRGAPEAAGLVLLYLREGTPSVLLTVRSADLPSHPGQIGLPGGMRDPGETLLETALREAREEVGVAPDAVRVLGELSPIYIPPTRILLYPFVGAALRPPCWRPHAAEVQRLLEVPVSALLDPRSVENEPRNLSSGPALIPYFRFGDDKVWGATAMVLAELSALLAPRARSEP